MIWVYSLANNDPRVQFDASIYSPTWNIFAHLQMLALIASYVFIRNSAERKRQQQLYKAAVATIDTNNVDGGVVGVGGRGARGSTTFGSPHNNRRTSWNSPRVNTTRLSATHTRLSAPLSPSMQVLSPRSDIGAFPVPPLTPDRAIQLAGLPPTISVSPRRHDIPSTVLNDRRTRAASFSPEATVHVETPSAPPEGPVTSMGPSTGTSDGVETKAEPGRHRMLSSSHSDTPSSNTALPTLTITVTDLS